MENSRDSSVWRSLAVAFGDGLAFGVGMKLSQNAPGKPGTATQPELARRLTRLEQKLECIDSPSATGAPSANLDPHVLEALTHALEARLQETAALMDRRLAELDVKFAMELQALRQQDHSLASSAEARLDELQRRLDDNVLKLLQQVNDDRNALQTQVISLHREFASAVADIVEEQVATQVEERVAALVEQRLGDLVRAQLAPVEEALREEIRQSSAAKHREISDLRQQVVESDRNVLDFMLATADLFRQAAGRLGASGAPPGAPPAVAADSPGSAPQPRLAAGQTAAALESSPPPDSHNEGGLDEDSDLPGFARTRKAAAGWSIPLVTSFLVTAGCIAWLQYL